MRRGGRRSRLSFMLPAVTVSLLMLVSGCKGGGRENPQSKATPDLTVRKGENLLTLDESAQKISGIVIAPLKAVLHRKVFQAYGAVVRPDVLIDVRNGYLSAKASADKAGAALDVSRREYERLKKLNEENHNISDRALEAAQAVFASNDADASAAREKLRAVKQTAAVQWGDVISQWIFLSSPEFNRLTALKTVLVRITLPADRVIETVPKLIRIETSTKPFHASFVSRSPIADPGTQGIGFLYLAPSHPSLIPGVNIRADMPVGRNIKGAVVPLSAVVWFHGRAWAYVQTASENFMRREVPVLDPVADGFFVPEAFRPGDMVVVKGAQILLSRESLPSVLGGREEDED